MNFAARPLGTAARLCFAALGLLAVPAAADTPPSDHALQQSSTALFASTFRQIQEFYLDPVSLEALAVNGMAGLDAPDHSFMVAEIGRQVVFDEDGLESARLDAPHADDPDGWAELTAAAIVAARGHSEELMHASDEELYQRVFDGITAKLDRFTRYAGRDQARDQRANRDGFGGIGVTLDYTNPTPRISSVVTDGPSARAGLHVDDRIVAIDDVQVTRFNQDDIVARLRGPLNSRVAITVSRAGSDRPIGFTLYRSLIVQPTVSTERQDGVAVFRVDGFNVQTAADLQQEIRKAKQDMGGGLKGAVLDLRGNPGGLLDQAASVASLFLDHGDIVSTRGRHPTATQYFPANGEDKLRGLPLVVLVNGGSASASEIVAAALQDNGRAVLVGSSSYGKGTVQMVLRLENSGELTLTWARLIAPSGYLLHTHGVVPTFCTVHNVDPLAPPEDPAAAFQAILDRGLRPATGDAAAPRSTLTDAAWERLRATCPADTRESSSDIRVAEAVLADRSIYTRALSVASDTVAHIGHAPASSLH